MLKCALHEQGLSLRRSFIVPLLPITSLPIRLSDNKITATGAAALANALKMNRILKEL
jgi:hypothetical protein